MLTLELSSYVLKIPSDAQQHSTLSQEYLLQADWLILENSKKTTLTINIPY